MKAKYTVLIIVSMLFAGIANCQHQLYFETFNNATNTFTINDTGLGSNKGNNKWIVDTNYFAGGIYPKNTNESSTFGGGITGAPYSQYLHIYDSASTYKNDNYNPHDSSSRFAHMTSGICAKSLTDINFNFYYLCQGSSSAYGLVYYSIDGGTWTQTGDTLYKKYKWQYATITSPAFTNVEDLRFGFLWKNNDTIGKDTSALGIDDVSLYGIYDSVAHPIKCTFNTILFDSCLGGNEYVYFAATLSDSTCDAQWDVNMSNGDGVFPSGYTWTSYIGPDYYDDITSYWYLTYPATFKTVGSCYKFKLYRTSYPFVSFTDSVCFPYDTCPGSIMTLQPPATLDTNPICAGSVIDVPFVSTGLYDTYNVYRALLIDSIGHTAKIDTIGDYSSNIAYSEPYSPYGPGDVVSTIPLSTPAGCHYYVKVVCNTGNRPSTEWGPFCIQHCDIKTNNQQSVTACMTSCRKQPDGYNDTIVYNDSMSHYYNGNKFKVQLISFMLYPPSFGAINTGLFGIKVDSAEGHFKLVLHVPCPDTLFMNGINPGVYYMRIIADSSNFPDSSLGSLVQITIGEPSDSLYLTLGAPGPYCAGASIEIYTNPDNQYSPYNSTYTWWATDKIHGRELFNPWNYGYLSFYNPTDDTLIITCQENNNGCLGAIATLPDTIVVLGEPSKVQKGPTTICLGDTGTYSIPFEGATNYKWEISKPAHADTSTNVLKIRFDTTGTVRVSVVAFNTCFTDSVVWSVKVIAKPIPTITANPSTSFCNGTSVTLSASGGTTYTWSNGKRTSNITVTPGTDTVFSVGVANAGCTVNDTVHITVYQNPTVSVSYCIGDTIVMNATGAKSYVWSPSSGLTINDSIAKGVISSPQTYTVIGTTNGCSDTTDVPINPALKSDTISTAVSIAAGQSVQLETIGGTSWYWSPPTGLNNDSAKDPIATPAATTIYTVVIRNANGCTVTDTVTVDVESTCGIFVPDIFSPSDPNNHNTILYVRSECLISLDFIVFDRWGQKVFESYGLNTGWDGTYKGVALNPGTFVYYATGKTSDGRTLSKKGNVTLVR